MKESLETSVGRDIIGQLFFFTTVPADCRYNLFFIYLDIIPLLVISPKFAVLWVGCLYSFTQSIFMPEAVEHWNKFKCIPLSKNCKPFLYRSKPTLKVRGYKCVK